MTRTALYRHFDSSNSLLYVGISLSAVQRLKQHTGDKAWAGNIASVKVEYFDTRDDAINAERNAIKVEKPIHNIMHNKREGPRLDLWAFAYAGLEAAGALVDTDSLEYPN